MKKIIPVIVLAAISILAWAAFFTVRNLSHAWMRVIHVALFGPWAYFLLSSMDNTFRCKLPALKQYLLLISVAVFCEVIQFWVPLHDPEWKGLAASLLGVILGREIYARFGMKLHA